MKLFSANKIANIAFKNHIIRSATAENMADDFGRPNKELIKKYELLAKGNIGGIITGNIAITQSAKPMKEPHILVLDSDDKIPYFQALTQHIHSLNTPIIAQLTHCGGQGERDDAIAPSKVSDYKAREMREEEIFQVIDDFAQAILRAKKSGFDGVQLHCSHGFLLSAFFSPRTNKRKDQWGGDTINRTRIALHIIQKARDLVGDFPILAKINGYETLKGGIDLKEGVRVAKKLEEYGFDGIEVSNGMLKAGMATVRGNVPSEILLALDPKFAKIPRFLKPFLARVVKFVIPQPRPTQNFNLSSAKMIKDYIKIPVIVVGGITDLKDMQEIIDNNMADFISLARPLIIEPNFVKKLQEGRAERSRCIQCNFCVIGSLYEPLKCYYGKVPKAKSI